MITRLLIILLLLASNASSAGLNLSITTSKANIGPGETVIWTILLSNDAPQTATGVQVRVTLPQDMYDGSNATFRNYDFDDDYFNPDPYPADSFGGYVAGTVITYSAGSVAAGTHKVFQFRAVPKPASADGRQFVVYAQAESSNGVASTTAQGAALFTGSDLTVSLSADGIILQSGSPFPCSVLFGYNGDSPLSNAVLEVPLPDGISVLAASSGYQISAGILRWNLGDLIKGQSGQRHLVMGLAGTITAGRQLSLVAQCSSAAGQSQSTAWPLALSVGAGLRLAIAHSHQQVNPSRTITWSVSLTNTAALAASGTTLRLMIPHDMFDGSSATFRSYDFDDDYFNPDPYPVDSFGGYIAGTVIRYTVGNIAPGETKQFQFSARPKPLTDDARQFVLSAQAESTNGVPAATAKGAIAFGGATVASPQISFISDTVTDEDIPTPSLPFSVSDVDSTAASLVLLKSSTNESVIPASGISFSGSGTNRSLILNPAPNAFGEAFVTLEVSDGQFSDIMWFKVTVNPINDPPVLSSIADRVTNEDIALNGIAFSVSDVETPVAGLTVSGSSSNAAIIPVAGISFAGNGQNRTLSITPAANANGTVSVTVQVSDGTATSSRTFQVTVNAVNDPPALSDTANQITNEDTQTAAIALILSDMDSPSDSLVLSGASSNPALVAFSGIAFSGTGASRSVRISPQANQFGQATITLTVSDGQLSAADTFVLTVLPVNDAPVISDIADQAIPFNGSLSAVPFTLGDIDSSPAALVVSATSSNVGLLPTTAITFGGNGTNRSLSLSPAQGMSGNAAITITVSDGSASAQDTFNVSVAAPGGITAWRITHFGALADLDSVAGDAADPDQDGISNLLEYAAGTSPVSRTDARRPTVSVVNNRLAIHFQRNTTGADLVITVEAADSLAGQWTAIARSTGGGAVAGLAAGVIVAESGSGGIRQVTITDSNGISPGATRTRYLRTKVTR